MSPGFLSRIPSDISTGISSLISSENFTGIGTPSGISSEISSEFPQRVPLRILGFRHFFHQFFFRTPFRIYPRTSLIFFGSSSRILTRIFPESLPGIQLDNPCRISQLIPPEFS